MGFLIFPKDTLTCEIAPGKFEDFFNCNKILVSTMYKKIGWYNGWCKRNLVNITLSTLNH